MQKLATLIHLIPNALRNASGSALISPIFARSIDFALDVGYANKTFAVHPRNDNWGKSWNGQRLLLKKFA
jgi:hypothetical protein